MPTIYFHLFLIFYAYLNLIYMYILFYYELRSDFDPDPDPVFLLQLSRIRGINFRILNTGKKGFKSEIKTLKKIPPIFC